MEISFDLYHMFSRILLISLIILVKLNKPIVIQYKPISKHSETSKIRKNIL